MDWGMLGYFVGDVVQERIPVVVGALQPARDRPPEALRRGGVVAPAASRCTTSSASRRRPRSLEMAFGPKKPVETFAYGKAEQRRVYDRLNANAQRPECRLRDARMSARRDRAAAAKRRGCSTARRSAATAPLDLHVARRQEPGATTTGYTKAISDAGGVVLTDTCSAFAQALPPGTKVAALDSAKQVHYLPAILGVQAWFGSTTRLHQRGADRPLERRAAMTVSTTIVLRGRKVVRRARRRRGARHAPDRSPAGAASTRCRASSPKRSTSFAAQSFKDKVLVFRGAKGSSGWSAMYHTARLAGTAPKALIFNEMTTKVALGAVVMRVPSVTDLDQDPLDVIETGDWVTVDADRGIVEIVERQ